jgi:hypothetical protein
MAVTPAAHAHPTTRTATTPTNLDLFPILIYI